jgi:glycosidase
MRLTIQLSSIFITVLLASAVNAAGHDGSGATSRCSPQPYVRLTHPEWSKNAVLHQLNTRQFSAEGTFRAAQNALPRLKDLGVDIIWLMPIHPSGEQDRKGTLGSPYSVRAYFGVNLESGTLEDLKISAQKLPIVERPLDTS